MVLGGVVGHRGPAVRLPVIEDELNGCDIDGLDEEGAAGEGADRGVGGRLGGEEGGKIHHVGATGGLFGVDDPVDRNPLLQKGVDQAVGVHDAVVLIRAVHGDQDGTGLKRRDRAGVGHGRQEKGGTGEQEAAREAAHL